MQDLPKEKKRNKPHEAKIPYFLAALQNTSELIFDL